MKAVTSGPTAKVVAVVVEMAAAVVVPVDLEKELLKLLHLIQLLQK